MRSVLPCPLLAFFLSVSFPSVSHSSEYEVAATIDYVNNLQGGLSEGSDSLINVDFIATFSGPDIGLSDRSEFFVYVLGNDGNDPSTMIGDIQVTSNIEANDTAKIYELWYKYQFGENESNVLFGLHDYNSTFYTLEYSGLFLNSSFGIGPDVAQAGPSIFNTTALGAVVNLDFENQYFLLASYDGIPGDPNQPNGTRIKLDDGDGLFNALEWGLVKNEGLYSKLAIGFWYSTSETLNPITSQAIDNNYGYYLIADISLSEHWGVFTQLGFADSDKNIIARYQGAGIVRNSLFTDGDTMGLAVARAENSRLFRRFNSNIKNAETVFEWSYLFPVNDHLSIQPDIQYVSSPSFDSTIDSALVFTLRLQLAFGF